MSPKEIREDSDQLENNLKIITQPGVPEIYHFRCDTCGKLAVSSFEFKFGYGSSFDLEKISGDFCEDCGKDLRSLILRNFPEVAVTKESI